MTSSDTDDADNADCIISYPQEHCIRQEKHKICIIRVIRVYKKQTHKYSMTTRTLTYRPSDVADYINWIYFFHAWGFQPQQMKVAEAMQLHKEALRMLAALDGRVSIRSLFRLCPTNSSGDDLLVTLDGDCQLPAEQLTFPLLRQQTVRQAGAPQLCLSDFVRPLSGGIPDTVGFFATSVSTEAEASGANDPYRQLLVQTLADRLAEAATEKMHQYVRRVAWGYAPHEQLTTNELLREEFQGIRPAVGYPSLPDQSVNFLLDHILRLDRIGITLTENGAMHPHASVCGLMLAHPAARYFSVGKIGRDQLHDYALRRGLPVEAVRKFLAANL